MCKMRVNFSFFGLLKKVEKTQKKNQHNRKKKKKEKFLYKCTNVHFDVHHITT